MTNKFDKYSDYDLCILLSKGKSDAEPAFAELYNRHNQRIYAYCLRVSGNSEDANDIFQETFLRFYQKSKEINNYDNIAGYLIKIARNLCLNFKRDKKEHLDIENILIHSNNIGLENKELLDLILSALELLPFQSKEVFVLRLIQGYTYEEISEITGTNIPSLKSKLFRAKTRIIEILQPYIKDLDKLEIDLNLNI